MEKLTRTQLIIKLQEISKRRKGGEDGNHQEADELLLQFIGDVEISKAYNDISKWYS